MSSDALGISKILTAEAASTVMLASCAWREESVVKMSEALPWLLRRRLRTRWLLEAPARVWGERGWTKD